MVKEAADEATQKGWCDTNLGKAKFTRDDEWSTVAKTNAQLEMLEAQRDQLSDDIDQLATEIAEATDSLSKTTENREAEKAENEETLKTAREGQAAIEEAIGILDKFYKGATKAKVSLLQSSSRGPVDDDFAKFSKKKDANKGNQAASGGILGMMAVIKSDFERTIKVTTDAEYGAAREFAKFHTATKASISSKETEKGQKEGTHQSTEAEIVDSMQDLESHQKLLDDVLKELEELNGQCIDTGMSYDDRVAKREEEIEALKEALCILDTDGVEDGC
jgi:predicted  nucleic acid-binding Zn-ribbon protein